MTSIGDLLKLVPEGESRLFRNKGMPPYPERFRSVDMNWDYGPGRLTWKNRPEMREAPWFGSRTSNRVPIKNLGHVDIRFAGPAKDMVDFYSTGTSASLVSGELLQIIDSIDGELLERRKISVEAEDGTKDYYLTMIDRMLDAIEPEYTDVLIKDEKYAGIYIRSVKFPDGFSIREDIPQFVHMLSISDAPEWYWSNELIDAAKMSGIRGIIVRSPRNSSSLIIDRF